MDTGNKKVTKEFLVTITVEEVEAPKVGDVPAAPDDTFSREAEEFFDEGDYGVPR